MTPRTTDNAIRSATGRLPALDGLRAVSILFVLLSHASVSCGFPTAVMAAMPWLPDGALGVRAFFVISGFLITTLLLREEVGTGRVSLAHFYQRRALRILPVYGCYLLLVAVYQQIYGLHIEPAGYWHALTFTTGLPPYTRDPMAHTWSLSVEEQFYLLWPLALVMLPRSRRAWMAAGVIVIGPISRLLLANFGGRNQSLLPYSSLGQGDAIMWGCAAAMAYRATPEVVRKITAYRPTAMRCLAVATIYLFHVMHLLHWRGRQVELSLDVTVQAALIAYLICSLIVVRRGAAFAVLNHPAVATVGVLSYSLYLWQQIFLCPPADGPLWWQSFPQNVVLVFIVGAASYFVIERPFLWLKDRLRSTGRVAVSQQPSAGIVVAEGGA